MVFPVKLKRVETMDGQESDGLPTGNCYETSSDEDIMHFADGDDILYTPDIGNPLPGKVLGFDGARYDIKLDKGTEMTVDGRCLIRHTRSGDTSSFDNSDESESSKGIKKKPWQNIANSDSETETEVEDSPKFCKGEWVWCKQDDAVPIRGRVTRDCRDRQDVHITLHESGAKRVCRQKFVSAATPPPDFVDPVATTQQKKMKESSSEKKTKEDTKQEVASDIARKREPGVRKSSRKKKPVVKPSQITHKASNNRSYEHKGKRFSYEKMEACFCTPSNSIIKEPKYYKTIKYVGKPGIDLSKATTHDVRFCYCVKCDEIVEYRAGYYKGIQRHYLEKHATKKEKDTMAANTSKGKPTNVKTKDSRATAKRLTTRGRKKNMGPAASDEALADADERKVLADERKMREDLEKRMKDLEKEHEKLKKDLETEKAKHAKEEKTKAKKEKTKADEEADDSKNRADDPKKRSSKHRSSSSTSDSSSASSSKSSSRRRGRKHKRKRRSRSHSRRSKSKSGDRRRSHRRHSRSKSGDRRRSRSKSPERSRSHRRHSRSRDRRRSRSKSPKRSQSHRRHSRSKSREHHSPTQRQQAHSQGGYDRYYRDNRHYGPSYDSRGPYGGGGPRAYNGGGNYYGGPYHY